MRGNTFNTKDSKLKPSPSESAQGEEELKLGPLRITYGFLCQGGQSNGEAAQNKDWFCAVQNFAKQSNEAFVTVCDGHGKDGHLCAAYASDRIPRSVSITI
jgi:serine/threonine protein phosphatase PrpC